MGHKVKAYHYEERIQFFNCAGEAWGGGTGTQINLATLMAMAAEGIAQTVIDFVPEVAIIICGLVLHRRAYEALTKLAIPTALILTESPYSDEQQVERALMAHLVFTNDKSSVGRIRRYNPRTYYLPHSFDPLIHFPRPVEDRYKQDVFFFGTLYPERRALFTQVDWTGIKASIAGTRISDAGDVEVEWAIGEGAEAIKNWQPNNELARYYAGSKISLNWARTTADYFKGTQIGTDAYSLGPRAYEIPACGGFMVSDGSRPELQAVYRGAVPTFQTAAELESNVRYYLAAEADRLALAELQRLNVQPCAFRERAEIIVWPEVERLLCR
ncbi:MAG: glycosyltransferase [Acidobacteria bacterium]|nr:glycosyltransferase [Acidobacteriota bacterium]